MCRRIVSTLCLLTTATLVPLAQPTATIQGVNDAALPRARVAVLVEGEREPWPSVFSDIPFDFGLAAQTIGGAEVVMSNAGATIAGHVTDARSAPISNYSVLVFSTDRTKWFANSRFLKFGRPAQDGGFEVAGLPPGEYWVVAVDAIQGNQSFGEWEKPDVLEPLTPRATRVTLAERERFITVLRLVRR
jgi:hypothetical protein